MSTSKVVLSSDVFFLCLTHALSTEREEIMGLLIGEIDNSETLHISASILLRRSDKKKDRVEVSPEQLTMASTRAEYLSEKLGKPMRVLGWYHSHPHITVWPSHIDLRTQATYQLMDKSFVGLIFSVFSQEHNQKSKVSPHQIQIIAFQSVNQSPEGEAPQYEKLDVPVLIEPAPLSHHCLEMLINFPMILREEEEEIFHSTTNFSNQDCLAKLINESVFTRAICHITEIISAPIMQALEGLSKIIDFENERKNIKLAEMELELSSRTKRGKDPKVTSS